MKYQPKNPIVYEADLGNALSAPGAAPTIAAIASPGTVHIPTAMRFATGSFFFAYAKKGVNEEGTQGITALSPATVATPIAAGNIPQWTIPQADLSDKPFSLLLFVGTSATNLRYAGEVYLPAQYTRNDQAIDQDFVFNLERKTTLCSNASSVYQASMADLPGTLYGVSPISQEKYPFAEEGHTIEITPQSFEYAVNNSKNTEVTSTDVKFSMSLIPENANDYFTVAGLSGNFSFLNATQADLERQPCGCSTSKILDLDVYSDTCGEKSWQRIHNR